MTRTLRKRRSWLMWLAAGLIGCSDPQCPTGFYEVHHTCFRFKDAGEPVGSTDEEAGAEADSAPAEDADAHVAMGEGDGSVGGGVDGAVSDKFDAAPGDAQSVAADGAASACSARCGEHEVCNAETDAAMCQCASGYGRCESRCVDLMGDALNCGSCGYACASGLSCKQGQCEQKIHQLVLGGNRTCALYKSESGAYPMKCWGETSSNLFRDTASEALSPRSVLGLPTVRTLSLSLFTGTDAYQCAVPWDRDVVRCWGNCGAGCGNGGTAVNSDSFFDNNVPGVAVVSVGSSGTCALNAAGVVSCWGELLAPNSSAATSPVSIEPGGLRFLKDVGAGARFACGIAEDARVVCWGATSYNVLGASDTSTSRSGVFVVKESGGSLNEIKRIAVGSVRSCAITNGGELWCWGYNMLGSLGSGDVVAHVGAVRVDLSNVVDTAVGGGQTCAITDGGQVYCWGVAPLVGLGGMARGDAQDGTWFTRPQRVVGLDDAIEIRAGSQHTCARRRTGQIVCWGGNEVGQLGDGTKVARLVPTDVVGLY